MSLQVARELSAGYAAHFVGRALPVLAEQVAAGVAEGLTPHYVKARVALAGAAAVGDIVWLHPRSWHDGALEGQETAPPESDEPLRRVGFLTAGA